MEAFIGWIQAEGEGLHPVTRAARVHSDFAKIHPFTDGNGRTARLLMNLELLRAGWPPVILPVESRLAYYEALDAHHVHGDFAPFMEIMIRLVKDSFRPYWFALGEDESTGG